MKKRFLSLTLLFLFVLGMAMPVSAHEEIDLSSLADVEGIELDVRAELLPLDGTVMNGQAQDASRAIITPDPELNLYITRISAYPLVSYVGDDGNPYARSMTELTYYANFPVNQTQSAVLPLTSVQVQAIKKRTAELVAASDIADKSPAFLGWHVDVSFFYSANRPKYIDYWATATNSSNGAVKRYNLTKTSGVLTIPQNFIIPDSMQDSYCNIGTAGNFYFTRTSNGQEGGFRFSGALTLNSDKNPHQ
ncbi:MAG: hypothetical protein K2P26_05100 [Oscillospiraceae bacterium]|nr:hypothetical protein [Oscillospiraceae bacterium]